MKNFTLIAGPCAIEDEYMGLKIAKEVKAICEELCIDYIFKASYKKANRSKTNSCLLYTSPSPRDATLSRMPSSA